MTRTRSVAAGQTIPIRGDVDANLERHARLIRAAAEEQVQALVFPELSLTGYELDLADDLAFSESDSRLAPLIALAASYGMTVIVGAPARIGLDLHIGAFIVSPDRTVGLYTKRHLGEGEETFVLPGDQDPLIRFGGNTAAVAVCADANRPSHPEEAADRGAGIYLVSTFITSADLRRKSTILGTYALQHSMMVVFANYGGPSGGLASGGQSAIWSETGELLAQLKGTGPGLAVATPTDTGWRGKSINLGYG